MYMLEAMKIEILKHLHELGMLDVNGGWERESKLDKNAVDELYRAKLVDKSISKGFIRLSEYGVGAVLFGLQNADKISELL
jgi:isopropylmalate/homocitrate/citramalate synthase